jgi:hypothetical protein
LRRSAGATLVVVCASTALLQLQLAGPNVAGLLLVMAGVALLGAVVTLMLVRQHDLLAQPAPAG